MREVADQRLNVSISTLPYAGEQGRGFGAVPSFSRSQKGSGVPQDASTFCRIACVTAAFRSAL